MDWGGSGSDTFGVFGGLFWCVYAGPRVIMPEETADEQQLTGADVLQAQVICGLGRKW